MRGRLLSLMVATAVAWTIALNSGRTLAFNLAYLLTGVLALSWLWAWSGTRFLEIRRYTRARRSQVGEYFEETLEVRNTGRLGKLWLELEDHSTLPHHQVSRVIHALRGRSRYRWQVRTLCQQRGYFRLGPMTLRSGDPLGLFTVQQELPATSQVVVYPATVELNAFHPPIADLAGGEALSQRTPYLTTNVAGIREYRPGDSFNRIHWLSTARTGHLMAKEFELDPSGDVWLFLDLNRRVEVAQPWEPPRVERGIFALRVRPGGGNRSSRARPRVPELPPSTTEYGVTAVASVARYFLGRNRAVGLVLYGGVRQVLQTDRGERQMRKVLEMLAGIQADGTLPLYQVLLTEGIRLSRNAIIVAVSPDPDPAWVRALREMRRRGVQSVAVVLDGRTFGQDRDYGELLQELRWSEIPHDVVAYGDPLQEVLGRSTPARGVEGVARGPMAPELTPGPDGSLP